VTNAQVGVVAFSFGLRAPEEEPNPCNRRLAAATARIIRQTSVPVVLIAQWEIAKALPPTMAVHVVGDAPDGGYLDTERVWQVAAPILRGEGVRRVIAVAQPVLHRAKAHRLMRADGFEPLPAPVGWIGFDSGARNRQWWTRGPVRLLLYALMQAATGRAGR